MNIIFPWKVGQATGWGRYGLGLALALRRLGVGVTLTDGVSEDAGPIHAARFLLERLQDGPKIVLHSVGNTFDPCPASSHDLRAALVVAESTTLTPAQVANLRTYDLILSGCAWFCDVLAAHDVPSQAFPQGVDTPTFSPNRQRPPRSPNDPFLIFSGGKIEYRKGHDLVIETFKQLRRRFPEIPAKLVCQWHNFWPSTIGDLHFTGHLTSLPTFDESRKQFDFAAWLPTQGIPASDVILLDPMLPEQVAAVIRECDAGLFLSRAEGNVNMSLAECCASGLPVLASGNTGHLEYLTEPMVTLASTWPTHRVPTGYLGAEGWGEVKPTECAAMLAVMEHASRLTEIPEDGGGWETVDRYADADDFASRWSWDARAAALVKLLESALG